MPPTQKQIAFPPAQRPLLVRHQFKGQPYLLFIVILTLLFLLLPGQAFSGRWRRGVPLTSLVPAGPSQGIRLVTEEALCNLSSGFATIKANYVLNNPSDKQVTLKAGIWRSGDNYLSNIRIRTHKFLFQTDPSALPESDLKQLKPTARLRRIFEKHGICLSSDLSISLENKDTRWRLADADTTYIIEKERQAVSVYLASPDLGLEMLEFENQSAYVGPDYLFTLIFKPLENIQVEVNGRAPLFANQKGERWLQYEGYHGALWDGETDRIMIQFTPPPEQGWKLVEAVPAGYRLQGGAVIWDNPLSIRQSLCSARFR